jgi:hypothetical protein
MISAVTDIACVVVFCGPPAACERVAVWVDIAELAVPSALFGESEELEWSLRLSLPRHSLQLVYRNEW